ncbi:hypothetical protein ZWY2020_007052 [Hordeum vulgare]|nr:hypothetical protein ZWY2020_007052 [Hordeum vulgare]
MMLEGKSCLVSRSLPSYCEPESEWAFLAREVSVISGGKRPAPEDFGAEDMEEADGGGGGSSGKRSKSPSPQPHTPDITEPRLQPPRLLRRRGWGAARLWGQSYWDFNSLVRNGEIYRLRRQNGIAEHWVYFSCNVLEWDAYDPYRERWIQVPKMPPDECFMCSDKESLAVGTELLVFGMAHIVFRYSILTNSWTRADPMNSPRCLFGSTSVGEKAYVAGGTDASGKILSSAEMYDSVTHLDTFPA